MVSVWAIKIYFAIKPHNLANILVVNVCVIDSVGVDSVVDKYSLQKVLLLRMYVLVK
jgi:hypothetical protein